MLHPVTYTFPALSIAIPVEASEPFVGPSYRAAHDSTTCALGKGGVRKQIRSVAEKGLISLCGIGDFRISDSLNQ